MSKPSFVRQQNGNVVKNRSSGIRGHCNPHSNPMTCASHFILNLQVLLLMGIITLTFRFVVRVKGSQSKIPSRRATGRIASCRPGESSDQRWQQRISPQTTAPSTLTSNFYVEGGNVRFSQCCRTNRTVIFSSHCTSAFFQKVWHIPNHYISFSFSTSWEQAQVLCIVICEEDRRTCVLPILLPQLG